MYEIKELVNILKGGYGNVKETKKKETNKGTTQSNTRTTKNVQTIQTLGTNGITL